MALLSPVSVISMTRHSARLHSSSQPSQPSKQSQAHNKNHDNRTRNAASMGLGVSEASKQIQKEKRSPAASKQHHATTTEKAGSGQRSAQEAISPDLFEAIRAVIKEEISSTTSSSASPLQKLIQQEIRKQLAWTCHGADRGCDWLDGTSASATQEYRSNGTATIARAVV